METRGEDGGSEWCMDKEISDDGWKGDMFWSLMECRLGAARLEGAFFDGESMSWIV